MVVTMSVAFAAIIAFGVWYLVYGLECFINGGMGGWELPFRCLWDDIRFNSPGGWQRRLRAVNGDEDWARQFPGIKHVVAMHVLFPVIVYIVAFSLIRLVLP